VMNVNKVTATVRYSQDSGKGAWKSLELGAEASINEKEDWMKAQVALYGQLAQQFKALWAQNGTAAARDAPDGHQVLVPASNTQSSPNGSPQTLDHWCSEHNQEWKPKNGKYGTFFSHKVPDGSWCNESNK
jgi:hypothetical protein